MEWRKNRKLTRDRLGTSLREAERNAGENCNSHKGQRREKSIYTPSRTGEQLRGASSRGKEGYNKQGREDSGGR